MTIYVYEEGDGEVEIVDAKYIGDELNASIKLLKPYSDGTGKVGGIASRSIKQLFADDGTLEIIAACAKHVQLNEEDQLMLDHIKEVQDKPLAELAELYNKLVPKSKQIKRFSDRETAIKRLAQEFAGGANTVKQSKTSKSKPTKSQTKETKSQTKETKSDQKPTKTPTERPQTQAPRQGITLVGKKSTYAGKFLYKTTKENPRKPDSHGWHSWNALRDGMTYEQFILNHGGNKHLAYDIEHGYVEVRSKPKVAAA